MNADLKNLETILEKKGFDTSIGDNVLAANKNIGDATVEITIDSGGGCLVKKTTMGKQTSSTISISNQKISKISFGSKTSQTRTKIFLKNFW